MNFLKLREESDRFTAMDKRKEVLIVALQDKDERIRSIAAEALEKLEIRDKLDFLVNKIETGEMLEKVRAIYAMSELKGPRIIECIGKAGKDGSEDVRAAAARALGSTGDVNALQYIVEMLKDKSPIVERAAIEALRNFKDPRVLGHLMQALRSPDQGVVERALEAICPYGDKRSEEAMLFFAVNGNSKMRSLAIKALAVMDR
jgi:HEAT repeat protein